MDATDIMTNYQFFDYVQEKEAYFNRGPLHLETIYVGMAFGDDGSRKSFDRISNHTKLQTILSEAFDEIEKEFKIVKSGYNDLYGQEDVNDAVRRNNERQKIDYFRALRSLTTAHTLRTTDKIFKKFGIIKGVYLEDVRFRSAYHFPKVEGDVILEVRKKDDSSNNELGDLDYTGVWLERDIVEPIRIVISKLKMVNSKLEKLTEDKVSEFINKKIGISEIIDDNFIKNLKDAVHERYPTEIEKVPSATGESFEYWSIQEIYDFVKWQYTFGDDRDLKFKALQDIKSKELIEYANAIQSMKLNNYKFYDLSSGISTEGIDPYANMKISSYLKWSKNYPDHVTIEFWKNDLFGASNVNKVSDEVWACLKLKEIQPELNKYFKLQWGTSLRQLYWQYLTALFVRQEIINQ